MDKLNKKLAEWAGFRYEVVKLKSDPADIVPQHEFEVEHWYWEAERFTHSPPNFTNSLDACFKWLVPKLNELGLRIHMMTQPRGRDDYFCSIGGKWFPHQTIYAETPALALCLAIEKLIKEG